MHPTPFVQHRWGHRVRQKALPPFSGELKKAGVVYFLSSLRGQTAKTLICTKSWVSADSRKSAEKRRKVRTTALFVHYTQRGCFSALDCFFLSVCGHIVDHYVHFPHHICWCCWTHKALTTSLTNPFGGNFRSFFSLLGMSG